MQKLIYIFLITGLFMSLDLDAQDSSSELRFNVDIVYPPLSMSKEMLSEANSIADLHRFYKPSWVREFLSVEIGAQVDGSKGVVKGANDQLTSEQKKLMIGADIATELSVSVDYMPENTLTHNEPKNFNFKFLIDPDTPASYVGGDESLNDYIKTNIMNKIPEGSFVDYDLAVVKFTIGSDGEVSNVSLHETTNGEKIDKLLIEAISDMPCWTPASYHDGTKVAQEFALTVGSMENCIINTLNFRRDPG